MVMVRRLMSNSRAMLAVIGAMAERGARDLGIDATTKALADALVRRLKRGARSHRAQGAHQKRARGTSFGIPSFHGYTEEWLGGGDG